MPPGSLHVTHGRPHFGQQAGGHRWAHSRCLCSSLGPSAAAGSTAGATDGGGSRTLAPAPAAIPPAALAALRAAGAMPPLPAPAALPAAAAAALLAAMLVPPPLGAPASTPAAAPAGASAASRPSTAAAPAPPFIVAAAGATPAGAAAAPWLTRSCTATGCSSCRRSSRLGFACPGCFGGSYPLPDALQMRCGCTGWRSSIAACCCSCRSGCLPRFPASGKSCPVLR